MKNKRGCTYKMYEYIEDLKLSNFVKNIKQLKRYMKKNHVIITLYENYHPYISLTLSLRKQQYNKRIIDAGFFTLIGEKQGYFCLIETIQNKTRIYQITNKEAWDFFKTIYWIDELKNEKCQG